MDPRTAPASDRLLAAIATKDPVSGHTHNFYRYPARFSPLFVREVVREYSMPGDVVFDPFMGGGTTVVEALMMGRKAIGVDLNELAHFVGTVKTTPLSESECAILRKWAEDIRTSLRRGVSPVGERVRNLPWHVHELLSDIMACAGQLRFERRRRFVRCGLLKTGQWAIDCRRELPSTKEIVERLADDMGEMIEGIQEFTESCKSHGLCKTKIRQSRLLLCRSTIGLEDDARLKGWPKPSLVVTSPPYPSVHILYHRWQLGGRKETPAPYWLAALTDGHFASHYTFGSRSTVGLQNYFHNVEESFRSVRQIVSPSAVVVQMVAFSDTGTQLPRYLEAMNRAGYKEFNLLSHDRPTRIWRQVPNRKWYCRNREQQDSAREVVLFHRPI